MSPRKATSAEDDLILAAQRQADAMRRRVRSATTVGGSSIRAGRLPPPVSALEFPGYEISGEIHRGGQGVVYRGVHHATRREVAIKVLRAGVHASPADRLRFEREAQILAQLRHPNIVGVHDSGVVGEHAFLVMDYIAGLPLDEHVRERWKLGDRVDQGLGLFAKVCEAVSAAHLRGVIHRDLKPANIRVDPRGEPHVLDFGLAKLAQTDSGDGSDAAMTQTGQFVGSLPWAAPEQAAGLPDQIDIRSDVYSLGVILYQMLTGALPISTSGGFREVLYRIQHADPIRPRSISRGVDDELETITLKCLAKERERRYQSAGELARDIRRYLAGEPIEAKRDSVAYVLRKELRRHRVPVAIASAFALVVVAGLLTSAYFWHLSAQQRDDAIAARDEQAHLRGLAEANEKTANTETAKSQAVTEFLRTLLTSADPALTRGREVTVREILDRAAEQVGANAPPEPEVEAAVRRTVGESYISLGAYSEAASMLDRATELSTGCFGADDRRTLETRASLARALFFSARFAQAEATTRDVLAVLSRAGDSDPPFRLKLQINLGFTLLEQNKLEEAESLLRAALTESRQILGVTHLDTLTAASVLGVVLQTMKRYDEAEQLQREALAGHVQALGPEHPKTLKTMHNLATTLRQERKLEEAEALHRRGLEIKSRVMGPEHPDTLLSLNGLALVLWSLDRREEAVQYTRQAVDAERRLLGPTHKNTITNEDNLANQLKSLAKYADLEALLQEVVQTRRDLLGEEDAETIRAEDYLCDTLRFRGKSDALREFNSDLIERWRQIAARPDAGAAALDRYARLLLDCEVQELCNAPAALDAAQRAVAAPKGVAYRTTLADALSANGLFDAAVQVQREIIADLPAGESRTRNEREEALAALLHKAGKFDAAVELMRDVVERRRANWPADHSEVALALAGYGAALIDAREFPAAETVLREAFEIRERRFGKEHWWTANTQGLLALAIAGQGRFEEAASMVTEAYQLMRDYPETPTARKREARSRVERVYQDWGRPIPADTFTEDASY
ncbi:MAG: serine/threonine-protein kinase [Phycisphaerae bacterium]